jgi:ABC-2 type transport system ATP-binding protein
MPENPAAEDLVVVRNLRKTYGATVAVDDVSLTVRSGEIFGILGPNGAGKTTTVESIAGLRTPDSGTVRVAGLDPHTQRGEITSLIGVQLQASELPDKIKAREALELYASFYPKPRDPSDLLEQLGLTKVQNTASCPGDRSSGCRSRSRWSATRGSRSSTSSPPAWTPRPGGTPGSWSARSATPA